MAENFDRPERSEQEIDFAEEGFGDKAPRRYQRRRPRQVVPDYVDWKDVDLLRQFIPERGKIMPRRISGITAKDQRRIATAMRTTTAFATIPIST